MFSGLVAVRVTTHPVNSPEEGAYELLGTMTGTLQVGATVNEGEQVAINKLAEWVTILLGQQGGNQKVPQSQ